MEKVVLACVFVASVAVAFDQTGSLHSECKLSTDCDGIGYWCSKNMTCQCLPGYVPNTELKTCLAAVGKKCQYDDNCIKGAFCKNQETCECKEFLLASFDKLSCNGSWTMNKFLYKVVPVLCFIYYKLM
ncbi:uncharacterized protein LOC109608568 isoform X2 [Aethina tumida]|uniref:uncharacterized protein LOC109608568 isoform X2 n=1 Tax=Aethina tumida TaxID=116153 RepID=UPI00214783CE|nr:uncharacterized protein LOC109608568 isoform X2 [Aethina tumida]